MPSRPGDHPGLDFSTLLGKEQHCLYQQLAGMAEWMVQIGRFDIPFAVTSINRFSAAPREVHIKRPVNIFGYLKNPPGRWKSIVILSYDIRKINGKGANTVDWLEKYTKVSEYIDEVLPDPRGHTLSTTVYFDSEYAHAQVTRRLVYVVMCFVGLTPIIWSSKIQGAIKTSRYSAYSCAVWVAIESYIAMRHTLSSLGVPMKGPMSIFGDNLVMIISCTNPDLELKNKHVAILYHKFRESAASGIFNPIKVCMMVNRSNILTKSTSVVMLGSLSDESYGVNWVEGVSYLTLVSYCRLVPRLYYRVYGSDS